MEIVSFFFSFFEFRSSDFVSVTRAVIFFENFIVENFMES